MRPLPLAAQVSAALAVALTIGLALGWTWASGTRDWATYLDRAALAGGALHAALTQPGVSAPSGLQLTALPHGATPPHPAPPQPLRETRLSILSGPSGGAIGTEGTALRLALVIVSIDRPPPLAALEQDGTNPAERLGQVLRMMARYCSDAVLYARHDTGPWWRIDGPEVWSCAAVPADRRLPATLAALLLSGLVLGALSNQRGALERVNAAMMDRLGGAQSPIPVEGPAELRALAEAANAMTAREQDRLAERAQILAGISHDLGTPTTRMRLRTALIADPELRQRFENDIEQMAGMIDAVLIHTREQMALETPIPVSVLSLVQSVADDFADTGASVLLLPPQGVRATGTANLFSGRAGKGRQTMALAASDQRMLALCRPKALRRAVSNLVENALKYGRRAQIEIEADAATLTIRVRDHGGGGLSASEIADLVGPFARGPNATHMPGSGMGLAIVDGIARQHGGQLRHDDWAEGVVASLTLRRISQGALTRPSAPRKPGA
jgi:signal transduction histidine kinase